MMLELVQALERATLNAVPAPRICFDGPFVLRGFLGGTGRANAASSLDPAPDAALAVRLTRIAAHYQRLGLPPRIRSTPLDPAGLAEALRVAGWEATDESLVTCGNSRPQADTAVQFLAAPDATWLEVIGTAEYQSPRRQAEKAAAVSLFMIPAAWLVLWEDGVAAAAMSTTCDGVFCGIFDLAVRPEFRRRGLARRMIGAAAHWAEGQGAEGQGAEGQGAEGQGAEGQGALRLFAHVAAANPESRQLQAGLGMQEVYRYRYFLQPETLADR